MPDDTRCCWIIHWAKKIRFIKDAGSKCMECGINLEKEPWKATFHHRDPNQKDFAPNTLTKINYLEAIKELKKCDLLCHNCHSGKHYNKEVWNQFESKVREKVNTIHKRSTKRYIINIKKLKEHMDAGTSPIKIAKKMQRSLTIIQYYIERIKNNSDLNFSLSMVNDKNIINIVSEHKKMGFTIDEISQMLGCSKNVVDKIISKYN